MNEYLIQFNSILQFHGVIQTKRQFKSFQVKIIQIQITIRV